MVSERIKSLSFIDCYMDISSLDPDNIDKQWIYLRSTESNFANSSEFNLDGPNPQISFQKGPDNQEAPGRFRE